MKTFRSDLHIHTCLSPCADWDMSPKGIVSECIKKDIDLIAICDHNTTQNSLAVMNAAKKSKIQVLPGFEICSKEEVHILAIFDDIEIANNMQDYIYENLKGKNIPEIFGYQVISNMNDEVEGENERFLLGAVNKSINEIAERVQALKGLCIPSHIDRKVYGLISQLGYIPENLKIDAVEMVANVMDLKYSSSLSNFKIVKSSDAHYKKDIGRRMTLFTMESPEISEIKKALIGIDGRGMELI
ncbi:MAG: PHP domain-containing protein [Deltaproteobacteria bacterium]|nr:PHP domain-containing protein [Deltaproteobacteria bacterium]